jgi:ribonuclease HII
MAKRDGTVAEIQTSLDGLCDGELQRLTHDKRSGVREAARREQCRRTGARAEAARLEGMLAYERPLWEAGLKLVAGVDEVGVGPLAGPVVAAAVILEPGCSIDAVDDSKQLDRAVRERLDSVIRTRAVAFAVASCSVEEIDRLNILRASCEAMRRAVVALAVVPEHLLVDARRVPGVAVQQTGIIDGDAKSQSIAAASIVAKVYRDALMTELGRRHPGYGFECHKGYATAEHLRALRTLGPCELHRRSFEPVRQGELFAPATRRHRDSPVDKL